ncbi:MAG TPA: archease [Actinomycetota bacterium]|nr:archease [Actinomycetota bacterium]
MGGYEVLEHTADVGIRARAETLEDLFREATLGLLGITGARSDGEGEVIPIVVHARDLGGALVDWLDEVLYLQDARDAVITEIRLETVDEEGRAAGTVSVAPRDHALEGTAVKAVTYHQLRVEPTNSGWLAEVYFDV